MDNILLDGVTDEWNGYRINTDFRSVIRILLAMEDEELIPEERGEIIFLLLFQDPDGTIREHPGANEIAGILTWLLGGWNHDNTPKEKKKKKLIDYEIDQWRIYADFLQIYGIDLTTTKMHFWIFQGLLWSMPQKQSSFLQVIDIRQKKPRKGATKEEREAITKAQAVYGLKQPEEKKDYTEEEAARIDAFDRMRKNRKNG